MTVQNLALANIDRKQFKASLEGGKGLSFSATPSEPQAFFRHATRVRILAIKIISHNLDILVRNLIKIKTEHRQKISMIQIFIMTNTSILD